MWLPPHNRRGLVLSFSIACSTASVLLSGCASGPKFSSSGTTAGQSTEEKTAPVFDQPEAAASKIASARPVMGLVAAPKPFAWQTLSNSAGGRSIEGVTTGQGGYRSAVIGSLAGDDPLAIELTGRLAKHIHENQIILGGIQATVIRNPNPDGAANFRMENGNGVYLNRQFVASLNPKKDLRSQEPEVRFLLGLLDDQQPQRLIHIRTVSGDKGLIAASSGSAAVAEDVCSWLNFRFVALPGNSAAGTLERFLSEKHACEVVTFAIPQTSDKQTLWAEYGDSLLNLLLAEDFETRKLARLKKGPVAADRRGRKHRGGSKAQNSD